MATQTKQHMQDLLDAADQVDQDAPDFRAFFIRWCTRYSDRNLALLWVQCPTATELHTYRGWLQHGRQVRKGERSIRLLAPHVVADSDGDERLARVRPISLFDVGQTDPIEEPTAT